MPIGNTPPEDCVASGAALVPPGAPADPVGWARVSIANEILRPAIARRLLSVNSTMHGIAKTDGSESGFWGFALGDVVPADELWWVTRREVDLLRFNAWSQSSVELQTFVAPAAVTTLQHATSGTYSMRAVGGDQQEPGFWLVAGERFVAIATGDTGLDPGTLADAGAAPCWGFQTERYQVHQAAH